ncbi:MAG: RNA pseudouridine synthase [Cocleimonas sp.]|nr:RNA pseudouridine synthase [Cocleimonas sp.]
MSETEVQLNKKEYHILVEIEGMTAVNLLAEITMLSKQKVKQAMQKGCVWLEKSGEYGENKQYTQRLRRAKKVLAVDETLHFYYDEKVLKTEPAEAKLISDQGDYSIWHKPSGMLSQGSKWGDHCTIYRWSEKHLKPERPAFIVHRLDRAASGLIIIAHKKQIAAAFGKLFQNHEIDKRYRVSVEGDFSSILEGDETSKTIESKINNKPAVSHVMFVRYDEKSDESILEVKIETGRKHQIRKHLSESGFPVVGDRLYGSGKSLEDLKLEAVSLGFVCPVSGLEKKYKS